jgi:hypothetical protein
MFDVSPRLGHYSSGSMRAAVLATASHPSPDRAGGSNLITVSEAIVRLATALHGTVCLVRKYLIRHVSNADRGDCLAL